jgi:hypothetical protein
MEGLQNRVAVIRTGAGSSGTPRHAHIGLMRSVAMRMAARRIRDVFGHAAQQLYHRQQAGFGWRLSA